MADPTPQQSNACDDQNHRRLLIFGLSLVISFTVVLALMWQHEFKVSDAVMTTIIMLYVNGIGNVANGLGARRQQQQEKPQ